MRLRPPLQALPRVGLRAAGHPALRGPARRGRLGRAARAGAGGHGDAADDGRPDVTLASVLPGGTPALVRANGEILLGVQMQTSSDDVSRDIGTALAAALEAPAGTPVDPGPIGAAGSAGPRLQELLDLSAPFDVVVHDDFGFWLEGTDAGRGRAGRARARERGDPADGAAGRPGRRLLGAAGQRAGPPALGAARAGGEAARRAGPARRAAEQILLGEGTRYAGAFRALGLVVPVWDLPADTPAEDWVGPAPAFQTRLEQALRGDRRRSPSDERRARAGLLSRQITLR